MDSNHPHALLHLARMCDLYDQHTIACDRIHDAVIGV